MKYCKFYIFIISVCFSGCAAVDRLTEKVGLLEKELSDLRRSQARVAKRVDDLQIQLSLLTRNPGAASTDPGALPPDMKVVKLAPDQKSKPIKSHNKKGKNKLITNRGKMNPVDPYQVNEKLLVDHRAAQKSLFGKSKNKVQLSSEASSEDSHGADKYQKAYTLYMANKYPKAIAVLIEIIRNYPESQTAIDALYLLGKSRWALEDYLQAQWYFTSLARQYPDDDRAAHSLLMAGHCQERLKKSKDARSTYLELVQAFPLSKEAAEANRRLKSIN